MEIVAFSDLHIHNYKQFDDNGSRLQNCLSILDQVFEEASIRDNVVVCSGDIYDNQRMLPTSVVNSTVAKFKELFEKYPDVYFYSISGNHDFATKNLHHSKGETALRHLADMFSRFILLDDTYVILGDLALIGIPYYEFPEDFRKNLNYWAEVSDSLPISTVKYLIQHQTPSGLNNPNIPIDIDVNDELYDKFDFIQNGHIHTNNHLITPKFLNVGNPLHRDLGDEGTEKGIWVVNTSLLGDVTFISNKGKYPEFKRTRVKEGETFVKSDDDPNYYTVETVIEEKNDGSVSEEQFGSNLKAEELVRNFWQQVDGKDEDLLAVGLSLIV